ncbi:hypothetical protein PFLUV_G00245230 [Perca fluviatilis]|uniref:Uncharacterized protein n=1 Tax=Perca fluviatilis TaxID=8168 RepID=A0A6A5E727_PERFL|nr:hypothetical protein PFLUV_G00245230 [Perca fluviatilis]
MCTGHAAYIGCEVEKKFCPKEGLSQAIDAGSPPAGSPVGRTAHHSISLNSNTKGLLASNRERGKEEARPRRRALAWHHVICAFPRSALLYKKH